jgi:DNA repair protein RAD5
VLKAQKSKGSAAANINDGALKHFEKKPSPKKGSNNNSDDEDEDSGDEAEKLNDAQLNEIDSIYRK